MTKDTLYPHVRTRNEVGDGPAYKGVNSDEQQQALLQRPFHRNSLPCHICAAPECLTEPRTHIPKACAGIVRMPIGRDYHCWQLLAHAHRSKAGPRPPRSTTPMYAYPLPLCVHGGNGMHVDVIELGTSSNGPGWPWICFGPV